VVRLSSRLTTASPFYSLYSLPHQGFVRCCVPAVYTLAGYEIRVWKSPGLALPWEGYNTNASGFLPFLTEKRLKTAF